MAIFSATRRRVTRRPTPVRQMSDDPAWAAGEREELGDAIIGAIDEVRKGLSHRIAQIESRCALLEDRSNVRWAGTWAEGQRSHAGELLTHAGSLWVCKTDTADRPGRSENFKLVVKSGRAGR